MSPLKAAALLLLLAAPARAAYPTAVEAEHGMVVSAQRLGSEAGARMLRLGGNAVDAAVAAAYAEAVTNPCCGNIGGGGFLVLHLADGRDRALDFRETAPAAATRDMFLDAHGEVVKGASLVGWKAAAVPGTVMGLDAAEREYGRLTRAQVMDPAIRLAREGFVLTRGDTDILDAKTALLRGQPEVARVFLRPDGTPLRPGERLVQPELADTLERIAREGTDAFYRGAIPQAVEAASRAGGGVITAADFAAYTVTEAAPVSCAYRGVTVLSAPPPSSGGVMLCEMLGVLSGYDLRGMGFGAAQTVHVLTETMRHAFLDRAALGDPAFVRNPVERLLSPKHAAAIRARILPGRATPSATLRPDEGAGERPETTQVSVLDDEGNAASLTYTINGSFGAGVMAPGTGFLLNDEMDDFTTKPGASNLFGLQQGAANAIAPGKRPLSSMAPSVLLRDGRAVAALGSPGGSRIPTIVLQVLVNLLDHGMAPAAAADAPRVHMQLLPDVLYAEPDALSPDTRRLLEGMGHTVTVQIPWGAAEVAVRAPLVAPAAEPPSSGNDSSRVPGMRAGLLYGANDDRRPAGGAVGD